MAKKNYATTSSCNSTCLFRKDYSYYVNHKCLECEFCYVKMPGLRSKIRTASLFDIELEWNDSAIKVPVTVSRYCDPLLTEGSTRNSISFMRKVLSKGGQIIFKTALSSIPEDIYNLAEEYKDDFMFHARVLSPDSKLGVIVRETFAPKFSSLSEMLACAERFMRIGNEVAVFLDPFIVGVNEPLVYDLIDDMHSVGIDKLIIKQLLSTDYFKEKLRSSLPRFSGMLSVPIGNYWTYENERLLLYMFMIKRYIESKNYNTRITLCGNKELKETVGEFNCCLYDNANAVYEGHLKIKDLK